MPITRRDLLATLPASLLATPGVLAQSRAPGNLVTDAIGRSAGRARLAMLFAGSTREDGLEWQQEFRHTLERLLGPSRPPKQFSVRQEARIKLSDHTRHELLLESPGLDSVPVYLLVPGDWKPGQQRPGILAVHGHGDHGHHPVAGRSDIEGVAAAIKKANYDYGLKFVR